MEALLGMRKGHGRVENLVWPAMLLRPGTKLGTRLEARMVLEREVQRVG
jgi:hypothetical protein